MENKKGMNMVWAIVICLILVGVFIFISVNNKKSMTTENDGNNKVVASSDNNATPTADVAKIGDTVAMNYTGRLVDGTVFDSNVDPKFRHVQPFPFTLGAGEVIAGWDKGIVGMKVGEKKTLTIPPEDGYGVAGMPPVIPPNATLIFEVELLAIKK